MGRALKLSADKRRPPRVSLLPRWRSSNLLELVVPRCTPARAPLILVGCEPWLLTSPVRGPPRYRHGGLPPVCQSSRPLCLNRVPLFTVICMPCIFFLHFYVPREEPSFFSLPGCRGEGRVVLFVCPEYSNVAASCVQHARGTLYCISSSATGASTARGDAGPRGGRITHRESGGVGSNASARRGVLP